MADSSTTQHPFAPLLTPEGWALLASLPPYDDADALTLGERLRAEGHSPGLVSAALTQQRLRSRAASKFGPFAATMLFTPDGLEQATRLAVSAHHAARYAAAGVRRVADLGCGIGGDALALAGLGLPVLAVERDEPTAALATVNLMPFEDAEVVCADALAVAGPGGADLAVRGVDAVFADPARRAGGRRLLDPEQWSPRLSEVLSWRMHVPALGVKVAPGIDHAALPADSHIQWVSVAGSVVEAAIWCGPLAVEGVGRSALVLTPATAGPSATVGSDDDAAHLRPTTSPHGTSTTAGAPAHVLGSSTHPVVPPAGGSAGSADGTLVAHVLTDPACTDPSLAPRQVDPIPDADGLGAFLYEPDGAVIRAGLVAHLAERLGARPVGPRIAYLTGDTPLPADLAPFIRAWRVREVLPLHLKTLKRYVRAQEVGRLEIRARGVDVSPDTLRASLRLAGPVAQTWALTRLGRAAKQPGRRGCDSAGRGAVVVLEPVN